MCVITKKGYKFETTGRTIPMTDINLADLDPIEFKELKETNVSMISQMQINDRVHNIESKIDTLIVRIDKAIGISDKINKDANLHSKYCPLNKDAIIDIVEDWHAGVMSDLADPETPLGIKVTDKVRRDIKIIFKSTFLTWGALAKAMIAIGTVGGILGAIIVGLMHLSGMK